MFNRSHSAKAPDDDKSTNPREEVRREVIDFVKMVVWFLLLFLALRHYVVEGYEVQGPSMQPTLLDGDRILVFKLPHKLSQLELFDWLDPIDPADIVVFESLDESNKRYVKRIIAEGPRGEKGNMVIAGEKDGEPTGAVSVSIDRGTVYVNDLEIAEDYLPEPHKFTQSDAKVYLGADDYYVMGDNRGVSKDSRSFGAVDDSRVIGKAVLRFWPLSRAGLIGP